jgi:carbon-monoxide dehydrogenase small subunit
MKLNVNGREIEASDSAGDRPLLEFIREDLDLTGAKNACDIGVCGACIVLIDGEPVKACLKKVREAAGRRVLTIEGMAGEDGALHPLQQAFIDAGAIQCGFCIPGMVLAAHAFLAKNSAPTRDQIRRAISPNLCRCTGYQQIVDAIESAAPFYAQPALAYPPRPSGDPICKANS